MDTLHRRVIRLGKLVDDILDYAQTDWDIAQSRNDKASGRDIMNDLNDMVHMADGLKLEASHDFLNLVVDRKAMTRVLFNLIDNAIKHHDTKVGKIKISIADSDIAGRWVISVADDGPGVPEQYREKIFNMFHTIHSRDIKEGSGIGLSVVKKIISSYSGEVWVEDNIPKGAIFKFTWPKELSA